MPKSLLAFNPTEYALVADRITLFYDRYPEGRIVTELVSRERDVVFKASAYRSLSETDPAATGWASEREGDGEINQYACLEHGALRWSPQRIAPPRAPEDALRSLR